MAYNEEIAERIKQHLTQNEIVIEEKKMFGGLSFLYKGKMTIGIIKDQLAVRIVPTKYKEMLNKSFVTKMDFTGKALKDFVYVDIGGFKTEAQLKNWIDLGIEHAKSKL